MIVATKKWKRVFLLPLGDFIAFMHEQYCLSRPLTLALNLELMEMEQAKGNNLRRDPTWIHISHEVELLEHDWKSKLVGGESIVNKITQSKDSIDCDEELPMSLSLLDFSFNDQGTKYHYQLWQGQEEDNVSVFQVAILNPMESTIHSQFPNNE